MFSHNWSKRLPVALLRLGNLDTRLSLFEKNEAFTIPKSFSSSNKKTSRRGRIENQLPFTVSYLVNSFGFSLDTAKSLSKKVCFESPRRPDSVLQLLRNNGLTNTHISRLVRASPNLLLAGIENNLLPKLEFLKSVGISGGDLADVVTLGRSLLKSSLKNQIIPSYNFLKKLLKDDEKVVRVLKRGAFLHDCAELMSINISLLQQLGVPQSSITLLLLGHPSVLCTGADKFDRRVKKAVEMGFNPLEKKFVLALIPLFAMTSESWERKLNAYMRLGWSADEFRLAFRSHPTFMSLSEENFTRKMDLFVNKMGWPPATVARSPLVLSYSMEKRILPRCSVIKTLLNEGLIMEKPFLTTLLFISDKSFLNRFVITYQEKMPQLLEIFQGKVKLFELGSESEGISEAICYLENVLQLVDIFESRMNGWHGKKVEKLKTTQAQITNREAIGPQENYG